MRPADAEVTVRAVTAADEARWRHLWDGYCRFYEVELAPDVTRHTWNRLMDPGSPVNAIVAEQRDPPRRGDDVAGNRVKQGGLARAIGAQ